LIEEHTWLRNECEITFEDVKKASASAENKTKASKVKRVPDGTCGNEDALRASAKYIVKARAST
jgi:hypothetical protein